MVVRGLLWLMAAGVLAAAGVLGVYVLTDGTMDIGELPDFGIGNEAPKRDLGPGDGVVVYPLR
jgi:hypothetical protein